MNDDWSVKKLADGSFEVVKEKIVMDKVCCDSINVVYRVRGFEPVADEHKKLFVEHIMPKRGTARSAGYDFFLPCNVQLEPKESILIWSDVKAYMLEDELLEIYPRSSVANKKEVVIKNVVGIIDSDYYSNVSNDGNIGLLLYNFGKEVRSFMRGEAICQGIFKKYLAADNCNTDEERVGGIGSTNK